VAKIGSPLFILREECAKDLMGVIEKLAEIGYDGIEFLGFFGHKPMDVRRKLESCGLAAIGNHVPFAEFVANTDKVITEHQEVGCSYVTIAGPDADGMPGGKNYAQTIQSIEKIGEAMNAAGMTLLYHNHADELRGAVDSKSILERLMDDTRPELFKLEPDLGWIRIGGGDPAYYLKKYANRCPVVHFKDYIPTDNQDGYLFRPTGYGVMNNSELYAITLANDPLPEWYVMDHDHAYDRDIFYDLAISLDYFRNLMKVVK